MLWHQIFCENILHIYKHVHLLYLYHRLRCTRIYWYTWYTVCLNVNAGFYVEVATCSNFYSLCTLSMINFRHENLAKLRFHQTAQAPKPHRAKGDSPWSRKSGWTSQHRWTPKVALSAGQDSNDGHRCITLVYVYVCMNIKFGVFFGRRFLPPLLQEWLRTE